MDILQPDKVWFRFLVLFFNCLLTFGSYFCFDMPSVLQAEFQGNSSCDNASRWNASCCVGCLGMTPDNYNLLYAIYAWTNAVVVIGAGFLIDKLGNRVGVFLFSFLCVLGSSIFATGAFFKNSPALLPVMLLGRLLFGSGNGSLTIVQDRITAFWFRDKELAMAFGFTLAFSRLGSVLNFLVTPSIVHNHGLQWTLWIGAMLCGIGFISAIVVAGLDKLGVERLGQRDTIEEDSKTLRVTDVRHFPLQFWLLVLSIMFFYNGVFPFVADASEFIQDKYDIEPRSSSYIAGSVYDISMLLSPVLGLSIDYLGKRGVIALLCGVLTVPVFGLLAFSSVHPLISTLWLGVTYSFAASSLWPSIPLVVKASTLGTAFGVTTSIQMIGIGLSNLIVGQILGDKDVPSESIARWRYVMIFLLANTLMCVTMTTLLNIVDKRRDGVLNESRAQRRAREHLVSQTTMSDDEPSETDPLLSRSSARIN